jgi:4-diphosphocytidyl-2-C-methyl-D-erythritol kinase
MTRVLRLRPPAKINLTLRVGPRRDDGFHDVQTVMQTIGLCDELTFTETRRPLVLSTFRVRAASGVPAANVPTDRTNLVWRAADALWRFAGKPGDPQGVTIKLAKRIPVAAGLGGGSADAAATLAGLNRLWRLKVPVADLLCLASRLGSDVPFFLTGGTALGLGRGDDVFPLRELPRLGIVIIKPSFGITTADAYRWLDDDRAARVRAVDRAARTLNAGWTTPLSLVNDLEPPVTRRHGGIAEAVEACQRAGAMAAAMTGSGSAVFGVFPVGGVAQAARRLRRPGWVVVPTRTVSASETGRLIGL